MPRHATIGDRNLAAAPRAAAPVSGELGHRDNARAGDAADGPAIIAHCRRVKADLDAPAALGVGDRPRRRKALTSTHPPLPWLAAPKRNIRDSRTNHMPRDGIIARGDEAYIALTDIQSDDKPKKPRTTNQGEPTGHRCGFARENRRGRQTCSRAQDAFATSPWCLFFANSVRQKKVNGIINISSRAAWRIGHGS